MKAQVNRKKLAEALKMATSVIASRSALPILTNVLVTAEKENGNLVLTATNLESKICVMFPANEIEDKSPATLPAKKMLALCDALSGDTVKIASNEQFHSDISCGSTKLNILGLDPRDFPEFTAQETKHSVTLTDADLRHLLEHGGYAVSTEDARKALMGMFFSCEGSKITAVSTDGKRLAMADVSVTAPFAEPFSCIIPVSAIAFLRSVNSKQIHFQVSESQLTVTGENFTYTTKLIQGNYPNWQQVVPANTSVDVTVNTAAFLEKLRVSSMISAEVNSSVRFAFSADLASPLLKISSSGPAGAIEDDMEIKVEKPFEPMEMNFNPYYILQALKQHEAAEFHILMNNTVSPVKMTFPDGSISVIMPMRGK